MKCPGRDQICVLIYSHHSQSMNYLEAHPCFKQDFSEAKPPDESLIAPANESVGYRVSKNRRLYLNLKRPDSCESHVD